MKQLIFLCVGLAVAWPACSLAATTHAPQNLQSTAARSGSATVQVAPESAGTLRVWPMPAPARPLASSSSFIVNFVAAGVNTGGVPCFNCVGSASGFTFGMPGPFNYVYVDTYQQYNVAWTNISYSGNCKVTVTIVANKTTIQSASATVKGVVARLSTYDYAFPLLHPASFSGTAVLTGKVKCGSETGSASAPIIFE